MTTHCTCCGRAVSPLGSDGRCVEQIVAHHMSLSGYAISEHIDAWAAEITRSTR